MAFATIMASLLASHAISAFMQFASHAISAFLHFDWFGLVIICVKKKKSRIDIKY
jgi:hypothetical protein